MPRKKKIKEVAPIKIVSEIKDSGEIISALTSLKDNPGWQIIKKIIDENVFEQEKKILNTMYGKEVIYNEEDLQKQVRRIYISIGEMPDREIDRLSGNEASEEDYDPYFKK